MTSVQSNKTFRLPLKRYTVDPPMANTAPFGTGKKNGGIGKRR